MTHNFNSNNGIYYATQRVLKYNNLSTWLLDRQKGNNVIFFNAQRKFHCPIFLARPFTGTEVFTRMVISRFILHFLPFFFFETCQPTLFSPTDIRQFAFYQPTMKLIYIRILGDVVKVGHARYRFVFIPFVRESLRKI